MIAGRFDPVLRELRPLSERFAAAGHRLFLVGGTVRDLVLAGTDGSSAADDTFDIDATTTARPDEIKRCLQGWADAVWTQGERFGTIGAVKRVPSPTTPGTTIDRVYEITTHRAEAYQNHSRKPHVEFSFDIEADLSRRDFTVNAMAIELTDLDVGDEPPLVDPFGGLHDLAERVLRTPLAPEASFSDDPLRMLRAARFIARYGLRPEPALLEAVRTMGERLEIVSAERVHDEIGKLLDAARPGAGLLFAGSAGLLGHVIPELAGAAAVADDCHGDLVAHLAAVVDAVQTDATEAVRRRTVRWAALLRPVGPTAARARMQHLRCSNDEVADVTQLIDLGTPLMEALRDDPAWTDADVRRHVRRSGELRIALHALVRAEASALDGAAGRRLGGGLADLEARIDELGHREPLDDLGPQLSGDDVMRVLGLPAGPAVGAALAFLAELRLSDGLVDDATARRRLVEWWSDHLTQ